MYIGKSIPLILVRLVKRRVKTSLAVLKHWKVPMSLFALMKGKLLVDKVFFKRQKVGALGFCHIRACVAVNNYSFRKGLLLSEDFSTPRPDLL